MTIKHWLWLAAISALIVALVLLQPILMPFVIASALAYLGDPIVDWLQRYRMSRTAGVIVVCRSELAELARAAADIAAAAGSNTAIPE